MFSFAGPGFLRSLGPLDVGGIMLFEIIAIGAAFSAALMIGFFWGVKTEVNAAKKTLDKQTETSINQMKNFNDIIEKASSANESLGLLCKELQGQITIVEEQVAVLTGNTSHRSASSWMKK